MKSLIIGLLLLTSYVNGQGINDDKKSGKYFTTPGVVNFIGKWASNEKELEFINIKKKNHHKYKENDYYYDSIYLKITKCIYKGEDVSKNIKEPVMLIGNSRRFGSVLLKDPITGDDIIIKLYYIDKNNLKLNVNTVYGPNTSTVFPLGDTILKRK